MNIQVTYRKTSRITMRIVKNGDVHISAPIGTNKSIIERFVEENKEWIEKSRKKTVERTNKRYEFFNRLPLDTKERCAEAMERLHNIIPPMLEKYTSLMNVYPKRVYYKATISKWGSCNHRTGEICFSAYLLLLPEWCIEHVVVHELAHLIVPNHSADFYAVMDKYFPRWKEARKVTKNLI